MSLEDNNAIGVILGNGRCVKRFKYDYPKLILQVHIRYKDGSSEKLLSDQSWKVSTGPIKENGIYYGEVYDAREEEIGWDKPKFENTNWINAAIVPGHNLASQMMEPIQITKILKPHKINSPQPGMYIFDFAQKAKISLALGKDQRELFDL